MLPWSHGDQHAYWVKLCLTLKASAAIAPYQYCEWMNINVDGWHILSHHQLPTSLRPGESRRRGRCGAVVSWPVLEFQDWPSLVLEFQDWTSPWNSRGWILHTSSGSELLSKRKWLKVEFGINPLPLDSGFFSGSWLTRVFPATGSAVAACFLQKALYSQCPRRRWMWVWVWMRVAERSWGSCFIDMRWNWDEMIHIIM